MRSRSAGSSCHARCSLLLCLVGVGLMAAPAEAKPRGDRPFVIKPDGVVLRPNTCIREPGLDAAWDAYAEIADQSVRRLAEECFDDERQRLLQDGVIPVIPREAVQRYWADVNGARATLRDAYLGHPNPEKAMAEWSNDVESQVPGRFPRDGQYLFVEDPVTRMGLVLRVKGGRVAWDLHNRAPDGSVRIVPGRAVPLPVSDGQDRMRLQGLVNPENGRKIDVTVDCLLQTYELCLAEPDGRPVRDMKGRIVHLSTP